MSSAKSATDFIPPLTDDTEEPPTIDRYILRNIDAGLWEAVHEKAEEDGRTVRGLILWLLKRYVNGEIK